MLLRGLGQTEARGDQRHSDPGRSARRWLWLRVTRPLGRYSRQLAGAAWDRHLRSADVRQAFAGRDLTTDVALPRVPTDEVAPAEFAATMPATGARAVAIGVRTAPPSPRSERW